MSLRRRVLVYVALAALTSCALTVAVAVGLVRQRISAQRMTSLERQADIVAAAGSAPGALGPGEHVYGVGTGRPRQLGPLRAAAILASIHGSGDSQGSITAAGRQLLYVARTTVSGRIVLVRSAGLAFAEWRPFLWSLVIAGFGGALLASLLAFLLARRLTRPIGELAAATSRLAAGEPRVRVPVRGDDELAGLARAFNAMSSELGAAHESQRSFLESVSHELKTPLTSIRGYAEALEESAVPAADAGRVIAAEAGRLERLVTDLLDLARFGRADFEVARRPVDLARVAELAVERHLPRARELSIELMAAVEGDPWVLADEQRLLQAVSNLIENALRLTPSGGNVTVSAAPGSLSISDTGPGLQSDELPRAFERFYLYERYRSERTVGTGLGLAIVQQLVSAMGGSAEAALSPNGGTRFILRLPPAKIRGPEPTPEQPARTGGGRPSA